MSGSTLTRGTIVVKSDNFALNDLMYINNIDLMFKLHFTFKPFVYSYRIRMKDIYP